MAKFQVQYINVWDEECNAVVEAQYSADAMRIVMNFKECAAICQATRIGAEPIIKTEPRKRAKPKASTPLQAIKAV